MTKGSTLLAHFDGAVHCGISRAAKLLQQTLNRLLPEAAPLRVDGIAGPRTLARLKEGEKKLPGGEMLLFQGLLLKRMSFYRSLAIQRRGNYRAFLAGWLGRLEMLYRRI